MKFKNILLKVIVLMCFPCCDSHGCWRLWYYCVWEWVFQLAFASQTSTQPVTDLTMCFEIVYNCVRATPSLPDRKYSQSYRWV